MTSVDVPTVVRAPDGGAITGLVQTIHATLSRIPDSLIAAVARFSIAAVYWKSGQTTIEGRTIDIVSEEFSLGWAGLACPTPRCS